MSVSGIDPAVTRNDKDTLLAIRGAGFSEGLKLTIGGLPLTDVTFRSSTLLAATLPTGLCPGAYPLTITDAAGHSAQGDDEMVVQGARHATLGDWVAGPAISLAGRAKALTLTLPTVNIVDTTCETGDWNLVFTLGAFSPFDDGHGALPLRSLQLEGADGGTTNAPALTVKDGSTSGTLTVPHAAGQTTASIRPLIGVDVPSHGYAGQYRMSVAVSILGDTLDEGARLSGGNR